MIPLAQAHERAMQEQQAGNLQQAEALYRQILQADPRLAQVHNNLGIALKKQGKLDEAMDCYRRALALKPDYAKAHHNLGIALMERGCLEEAVSYLRVAIRLQPDYAEAHTHLGAILMKQGRIQEATASCEEALRLRPDYPEGHRNMAMLRLILGDFERGWPEYEWRCRCMGVALPEFHQPRWDGSALEGRTILLFAEQGLGDALQFVRYGPLVAGRGGRVWLNCPAALCGLLAGSAGIERVILDGQPIPPFDLQAPLMSLPAIFKTTLATVPAEVPYIRVDDERRQHWQRQLAGRVAFKVGIAWQGNPEHPDDRRRSVALQEFAPLANLPGVQLISLQKGAGTEQLPQAAFPVLDLGSTLGLVETGAVIQNLDLVISIDSAIAHLAGALAAPVWLALAALPDFRWMLEREDSPWYPTMRLFRQSPADGWQPVFARMAAELSNLLAAKRT